jgi:predicted enzyme related to lactoylglutathione lyase
MKFASTRLIAADIKALVGFYEKVTGQTADWLAPVFAELVTPGATLAIGSVETVGLFKEGSAEPAANRTAIIEFQVEDVEGEFARLKGDLEVVHEPKMMPWGNRAAQFRDPEGTLVSLYTPVTDAAKRRFGSRGRFFGVSHHEDQ